MTDRREITIVRRPGLSASAGDGLAEPPAAYRPRTEAEKGEAVADVNGSPDRYRAEILSPRTAFADMSCRWR